MTTFTSKKVALVAVMAASSVCVQAADWPTWGGTAARNMISEEKGLPVELEPGKKKAGSDEIDLATTKNVSWVAKLGGQSYGTPSIAGGKVFVGTNNEFPRDEKHIGDRGVVMSFDEYTGKFLWQLCSPKLGAGKVSDWEFLGMCSAPTIVGNRGYVITNRCEVLCLDVNGLADGNQGMTDEGKYLASPGKDGTIKPVEPGEKDADVIWVYDLRKELGVFPHNIASSYALVVDGKVYVSTSNGVDYSHINIPAPTAPSFVCLDAETGEYEAEMAPVVSERVLHCSWSSPSYGMVAGKPMVFFAAGDGFAYGLGAAAEREKIDDDIYELPIKWTYDANPPEYRKNEAGEKMKYAEFDGPSECIATPVIADGLLYVAIGQDPEHGEGVGMLSCIDPSKADGDITGKALWTFKDIERSISTPAVKDGLLYTADYTGRVFCLDAKTGKEYWRHDTLGHIWANPLLADGKIYIGNEEGELFILAEGKEKKLLGQVEFSAPLKGSVVAANGALFIATETHLYCFKEGAKPVAE
jgi:outer membrane protein assembly factor BamB